MLLDPNPHCQFRLRKMGLVVFWIALSLHAQGDSIETRKEYALKASWLTKFIKYTEWPANANHPEITIGILGVDPFLDVFAPVEGLALQGRTLVIKRLGPFAPGMDLSHCDLLFIASSEQVHVKEILEHLGQSPVLTVSEFAGFTEFGGMINFLPPKKDRIRYEVNQVRAEQVGFRVTSPLLRYADRVVSQDREGRIRH